MASFAIFIVVKGEVKLFIMEGGAGSLMYLRNKEICTFNHVVINRRDGIFLKQISGYIKICHVIVEVVLRIEERRYDIIFLAK